MSKPSIGEKWFTCTPVRFVGDHTFFARDSGLLCKGFQEIGIECKAIMPGPPMGVDQVEDLIRTDYQNLEDPEWWASLGGHGVIFYGWGSGKYVKIARAIRQSGLFFVTHMDTAGMLGFFNGFRTFAGTLWRISEGTLGNTLTAKLSFAARLCYASSLGLICNDLRRAQHLKCADIIGAVSPIARERIHKVCRFYGGDTLANRVRVIPHPVAPYMAFDHRQRKKRLIVCVGRWNDAQKDTNLLLSTAEQILKLDKSVRFEIYGRQSAAMEAWHRNLAANFRDRIDLKGVVPNSQLANSLVRAQISLCTSVFESFHIASAEALCCGCSVVGPDVPEVPSMKWFTEHGIGRMAARSAESMATAVLEELSAWQTGRRDPEVISERWTKRLHSLNVARLILKLCEPI